MAELNEEEKKIVAHSRTMDQLEARIANVKFYLPEALPLTLCVLTLHNGHKVQGVSPCTDPMDGQSLAYTDAVNKLWELENYLEAELAYRAAREADSAMAAASVKQ